MVVLVIKVKISTRYTIL